MSAFNYITDCEPGSVEEVRDILFSLAEEEYKRFSSSLMPTLDRERVIGVRIPKLRALASLISKSPLREDFISLKNLPHKYFEEDALHAFILEDIKSIDELAKALDIFLPYVDNWSVCDSLSPKIFKKREYKDRLCSKIKEWIRDRHTYTVRFAIGALMKYYLDSDFKKEYSELVASVRSDEYYVKMMVAWYFATALAKQYDSVIDYITENRLDTWTHNKTIRKATESFRISPDTKALLRRYIR